MTKLHDDLYLLITQANMHNESIAELNNTLHTSEYSSFQSTIYGHVGIASAVTANARIEMMKFKLDETCAYSDTDSIFLGDNHKVQIPLSNEIGEFKDELNGLVIKEAIFLGIKQYGYKYTDKNGKLIEKSVLARVKRDTLSFDQFEHLLKGGSLQITNNDRFYRSFGDLNISIKKSVVNIVRNTDKTIIGYDYLPLNINTLPDNKSSKLFFILNLIKRSYYKAVKLFKNTF